MRQFKQDFLKVWTLIVATRSEDLFWASSDLTSFKNQLKVNTMDPDELIIGKAIVRLWYNESKIKMQRISITL